MARAGRTGRAPGPGGRTLVAATHCREHQRVAQRVLEHRRRELSLAVAGEKKPADALTAIEAEMAELAKKDGKLK